MLDAAGRSFKRPAAFDCAASLRRRIQVRLEPECLFPIDGWLKGVSAFEGKSGAGRPLRGTGLACAGVSPQPTERVTPTKRELPWRFTRNSAVLLESEATAVWTSAGVVTC
jgi:hypothetical protein